ncbi:MAG: gliding motility lipoprotein GldH [Bacteroidales bacterium]
MKHHFFTAIVCISIIGAGLSGCEQDYFLAKSDPVSGQAWPKEHTKGFNFSVQDTSIPYHFILSLRTTTDYEFQNLYLFMNTIYPDQSISRDTLEILLAGPDGKWLGKGKGFYRDNLFLFKKNVHLPMPGNYRVEFVQAMRKDTLKGIDEIGLRIQKNLPQQ